MKYTITLLLCGLLLSATAQENTTDLQGYWMQEGYGVYLEIDNATYKMYDVTEISCQPSASGSIDQWVDSLKVLLDLYEVMAIDQESMVLQYGITSYKFNRLDEPLGLCNQPTFESKDPRLNFDIFWYTFKENYAYSEIREVDWDAIYDAHTDLITDETSEVELFGYIAEILDAIQDAHISLRPPEEIVNAYLAIREVPDSEEESSNENNSIENKQLDITYDNPRVEAMLNITNLFPETDFQSYHKDLMLWGHLNKDVGYLQINSMNGFSQSVNVDEALSHDAYWDQHWKLIFENIAQGSTLGQYLRNEINGAKAIQKKILSDFNETTGLIIDLRFNPGGTDKVAMELLSGFTNKGGKAFTKKVWQKGEATFESPVFIPESKNHYPGKIVVLTSTQTGSSAETFVLAAKQVKDITQVGSNTMGIFSDVLQKRLPNGWAYGLSNEIYETVNGDNYEYEGIPPFEKIEYPRGWYPFHVSIIEQKESDPAIDKAISILNKN